MEFCGCWHAVPSPNNANASVQKYLPQVNLKARSTILSTISRTTLSQTFINPDEHDIQDVRYTFPLFDDVSVVGFRCQIGNRVIHGTVKEHMQARKEYLRATNEGKAAALLEQSHFASDTFTTSIGKVPPSSEVVVHITLLGELQHDAQADGIRLTIPSVIAPRYGNTHPISQSVVPGGLADVLRHGKIDVTVDVEMGRGSVIKTIQSPSHPLTLSLGRTSAAAEDVFEPNLASAAYSSKEGDVFFEKDFVVIVKTTHQPSALLETHPTIPNQRAIMATLVPKFNLPHAKPEIVFLIDRSGSMGDKVDTLKSALRVFLKSIPVGIKFNICSFGSRHSFMWEKSRTYDESTLADALDYVAKIRADMGGTEMFSAVRATVENRFRDLELEVLLLTDGEIWEQETLLKYISDTVTKDPIRFFSLGIGDQVSHSLIQGIARAGDGFAQSVTTTEQLDQKLVRMLKGALTPHIRDYTLSVQYDQQADDDEYEIIDKSNMPPTTSGTLPEPSDGEKMDVDNGSRRGEEDPISLFDPNFKEEDLPSSIDVSAELPALSPPKILQAPFRIPSLYSFSRTTVYLLLSSDANAGTPRSITLRGTSSRGPVSLTIPLQDVGQGATIHQLAARRVMLDLEEGRGWVYHTKDTSGKTIVEKLESKKEDLVKREAVRLGLKFQVGGKWCSFVAVEEDEETVIGGSRMPMSKALPVPMTAPRFSFAKLACARAAPRQMMAQASPAPPPALGAAMPISGGAQSYSDSDPFAQSLSAQYHFQGDALLDEDLDLIPVQSVDASKFGARSFVSKNEGVSPKNQVHAVISHQLFEGSWQWDDQVFSIIGITPGDLEKLDWARILGMGAGAAVDQEDEQIKKIVVTLAVATYLDVACADERETWELVYDKALGWADDAIRQSGGDASKKDWEVLRAVFPP
ncbi:hypothetical protein VTO42DRAFT_2960 [Malbranchea cinnamomea]